MKFRKKPVVIDAVRVLDVMRQQESALPDWVGSAIFLGKIRRFADSIAIETAEGIMRGDMADWLIRGVKGELYPCKPDIFEATYDPLILQSSEADNRKGTDDADGG